MMNRIFTLLLIVLLGISSEACANNARLSDSSANYYPEPWARPASADIIVQIELPSHQLKPIRVNPREVLILLVVVGILGIIGFIYAGGMD